MQLLLLSNSRTAAGFLVDYLDEIRDFAGPARRAAFVPYASVARPWEEFTGMVREALKSFDVKTVDGPEDLSQADLVMVGGGNTFQLLRECRRRGLLEAMQKRVRDGMKYIGWSAGSNLACPTIKTTNDMPIVEPPRFEALNLIPFQINPHYLDPEPGSTHMGETREQRIREFHEMNEVPVVGLREGAWLRLEGRALTLGGRAGARLFRRNEPPAEYAPGDSLSFLME